MCYYAVTPHLNHTSSLVSGHSEGGYKFYFLTVACLTAILQLQITENKHDKWLKSK